MTRLQLWIERSPLAAALICHVVFALLTILCAPFAHGSAVAAANLGFRNLLQRDPPVRIFAETAQRVSLAADRAQEVDAGIVNLRRRRSGAQFDLAADAFPHPVIVPGSDFTCVTPAACLLGEPSPAPAQRSGRRDAPARAGPHSEVNPQGAPRGFGPRMGDTR